MRLTAEQLEMLRKPFERIGAFQGRSEEEITRLLEDIAEIYSTLMNIKLKKLAKEKSDEQNNYGNSEHK